MMMWSHEPAAEQKAAAASPPTRQRSSVAKLTTASSSLANLLSVFVGGANNNNSSADPRPPPPAATPVPRRSFDEGGGVGLGIVAAMSHDACLTAGAAEPIAIGAAARRRPREEDESYTCVIKHVIGAGGGSVRKRVYFGFGDGGGWLVEADDAAPAPATTDFLSRCCLCDKRLDGLDIYMYRGEKAFCSSECRCQQMLMEDRADKCASEVLIRSGADYSVSPHSVPMAFSPSVAAA